MRFSMRHLTLIGLGLAVGSVGMALAQDKPEPPVAKRPLYWSDPRLEAAVTLPKQQGGGLLKKPSLFFVQKGDHEEARDFTFGVHPVQVSVAPVETVAKALREQTKAGVFVYAEFGGQYVALHHRPGSAREVMESLEETFAPARWWKHGDRWFLARTLQEVNLMMLSPEQRVKASIAAISDTLKSIPPPVWEALVRGQSLPVDALPAPTQRALWQNFRLTMTDVNDPPHPEIVRVLNGGKLNVRFSGSGRKAVLGIDGPDGYGVLLIPFYHPVSGALQYGVPPPH